uniref:Ig-like domain-containing protein n=1 Tax=Xiphophorus couchianus TaxID=32473 RepID=A0A3B5M8W2_9TELE
MNLSDLPSFTPGAFPPSAFNYERPRHFIQSQAAFQAPSYESVLREAQENQNNQQNLSSTQSSANVAEGQMKASHTQSFSQAQSVSKSVSQTQSQFQSLSLSQNQTRSVAPGQIQTQANGTAKSSPSSSSLNSATTPASSAAPPFSSSTSLLPPSTSSSSLPRATMRSTITLTPRVPSASGLGSASLPANQDTLNYFKLMFEQLFSHFVSSNKNAFLSCQKLSYEERMARRLLGPDNHTHTIRMHTLSNAHPSRPARLVRSLFCLIPVRARHHSGTDERSNEGSAIQEKCFAPRFLQIPPDLTVEEGRFCRIDFKVSGLPAPDISWYLDDKAIRPDDYHKMLVCEKGMHSFIIEIVTVHHAGVYECVAKNRAGEGRFTMRLDVIAQEALRPPTFIQKMLNTRALEGDTVRLECKVDASPPPQLFWKKDKDMLRVDPNRMSLYQDGSGRQCLLIDRVTKSDSGWYTLSAINEAGMSTCNARLDVGSNLIENYKLLSLLQRQNETGKMSKSIKTSSNDEGKVERAIFQLGPNCF